MVSMFSKETLGMVEVEGEKGPLKKEDNNHCEGMGQSRDEQLTK